MNGSKEIKEFSEFKDGFFSNILNLHVYVHTLCR